MYKVALTYEPFSQEARAFYNVKEVTWRNENWLRVIFNDGNRTLIDASKCYWVEIVKEQDDDSECRC